MSKSDYLKELGDAIALSHWAQSNEKTYEEICDRVVNYICDDQSEEGRNYNRRMKDLLKSKKFIPNSPCWINSGTDMKNLFACYVIDLQDNMNSIMDTAKRMAMIMKEGGGVGVSLTPIRAEGARVGGEGSNRTASGPVSFLKVFDAVVGAVKSAGVRRGAALANLKTGHPDLIKFIKCKEDQNQINNFNLSVAITDAFMEDVIQNRHSVWAKDENDRCYTAAEIYDIIVHHMWQNGEPGVQFIDTVNNVDGKYTGRPEFREFNTGIEVSNPCGETFLKPNEACNLASINLYHFVNPFWKGKDENKDMALRQELKQTVEDAVEFLNKMLDKSETPFPEINEAVHQSRKVGLGVMGLADYLSAKGIVYGSPEAVHEATDIFAFISKTAEEYSLRKGYKNATLTVQAPTGTTGLVGEVSTGIEPHFLRCWTRHSLKMGDLLMYPKSLRDYIVSRRESCRVNDHNYICWVALEKAMEKHDMERFCNLVEGKEYYNDDHSISDEIKKYWPTAHEVKPTEHLLMLAAIQKNVHNSVSKTINLPHDATVDDVRELITTAWRSGCKGFTCYRDGSRDSQPLKAIDTKDKSDANSADFDAKFKQMLREGKLVIMTSNEYDVLNKKATAFDIQLFKSIDIEEMEDSEEISESAKDMLKKIYSNELQVIRSDRLDRLEEKAKAFDKITADWPATLLPKEQLYSASVAKDIRNGSRDPQSLKFIDINEGKDSEEIELQVIRSGHPDRPKEKAVAYDNFAKDMNVPDKNLPCKRPRPNVTYGETVKTKIGCGSIYITVNKDENGTCEVFTNLGRAGGCPSQSEATSRLISLALRSGVKVEDVIDQLKGIRCMNTMRQGGIKQSDGTVVLSCPDAIGKAIEKFHKADMEDGLFIGQMRDATPEENASIEKYIEKISVPTGINIFDTLKCPDCGKPLARDGGCVICRHCGYSKCG